MNNNTMDESARQLRRYLQIGSASSPTVSPDGRKIAFLNNVTGTHQAWQVDDSCPWPKQLTFGSERVRSVSYSPCGRYLAYSTDVGGNERTQIHIIGPGGVDLDLSQNPAAFHTFGCWSPDGSHFAFASNMRKFAHFDIYIQPSTGGEAKMVMRGDSYYLPMSWSEDGKSLLAWELRGNFYNRLYRLDIDSGESKELSAKGEQQQRYYYPNYTAAGDSLFLITDSERDFLGLGQLNLESTELQICVEESWDVESFSLSADKTTAAYVVNQDGLSVLKLAKVIDDKFQEARVVDSLPKGQVSSLSFSKDGGQLVFAFHGPRYNPNIWSLDVASGKLTQRTFAGQAGLHHEQFIEPEVLRFKSFDGLEIPGLLYKPVNHEAAKGKFPVIVHVHGGPESQTKVGFAGLFQYFLSRGYAVFAPNVRGSVGYGKNYADLDNTDKRLDSVRDLAEAALFLKSSGLVDPERIAVMGGSYGGYMTLAAVSMYPEHWAAGVDVVGIANLRSFINNTGAYRKAWRVLEYGDPEVIGEYMDEASPINHVDKITAPLMVIHGANDPRVPQDEAEQMVGALRELGRPVEYLLYEDEGHGVAKLHNRIHCYSNVVNFLDQHLSG